MGCAKGAGGECATFLHPATQQLLLDGLFILAGIAVIILATGLAIRTFMVPDGAPPSSTASCFA